LQQQQQQQQGHQRQELQNQTVHHWVGHAQAAEQLRVDVLTVEHFRYLIAC
jgi:hypothetical protein